MGGALAAVMPLILPALGVGLTVEAVRANGKIKKSRQLKDNVFALIYDYLGYDPDTQTERIDMENIGAEGNKTAETLAQTCECGYVFEQKMQFYPHNIITI